MANSPHRISAGWRLCFGGGCEGDVGNVGVYNCHCVLTLTLTIGFHTPSLKRCLDFLKSFQNHEDGVFQQQNQKQQSLDDVDRIVRTVWKYAGLRSKQADIVSQVLSGRDVVAVLNTGAGKSLTLGGNVERRCAFLWG